ncbi:MAG: hypothetical protein ACUVTL_06600 [Thermoproteota archaeon]
MKEYLESNLLVGIFWKVRRRVPIDKRDRPANIFAVVEVPFKSGYQQRGRRI